MFEKNYEIKPAPPRPSDGEYLAVARQEWQNLLASDPDERSIQAFLERNPSFLPGSRTPGSPSGHGPFPYAVISQPRLPGLKTKIPDFMWIATHSTTWFPTLIEIERPSKRLFRKDGTPTAEFSHAREQLNDWRVWFSKPVNQQLFISSYGVPSGFTSGRTMQLHMCLIYGRRSELEGKPTLSEKKAGLLSGNDEELMSFDRLTPELTLLDALTVRAKTEGLFEAIAVPPTFVFSPFCSEWLRIIEGIDSCLQSTPLISNERRRFLVSRLSYWREWSRCGRRGGLYETGDEE